MAFGKKNTGKQTEQPAAPSVPTTAGAPSVSVRKEWTLGRIRVSSENGRVCVFTDGMYGGIALRTDECAALADALLQAAP